MILLILFKPVLAGFLCYCSGMGREERTLLHYCQMEVEVQVLHFVCIDTRTGGGSSSFLGGLHWHAVRHCLDTTGQW